MTPEAKRIKERIRKIADSIDQPKINIEPMVKCLHGLRCHHLDAPGMVSPICEIAVSGIFDLRECPLGLWWIYERV